MSADKAPAKRPTGRPKGAKNKSTLAKQAVEDAAFAEAVSQISSRLTKVVDAVLTKAEKGDIAAARLILERAIAPKRAIEGNSHAQPNIQIVIKASEVETNGTFTIDQEASEADDASGPGTDGAERSGSESSSIVPIIRGSER